MAGTWVEPESGYSPFAITSYDEIRDQLLMRGAERAFDQGVRSAIGKSSVGIILAVMDRGLGARHIHSCYVNDGLSPGFFVRLLMNGYLA